MQILFRHRDRKAYLLSYMKSIKIEVGRKKMCTVTIKNFSGFDWSSWVKNCEALSSPTRTRFRGVELPTWCYKKRSLDNTLNPLTASFVSQKGFRNLFEDSEDNQSSSLLKRLTGSSKKKLSWPMWFSWFGMFHKVIRFLVWFPVRIHA